jgi:hypothetical protein
MNLNGIEASRVDLRMGNLVQGLSGPYALVTANIITPVILQLTFDTPFTRYQLNFFSNKPRTLNHLTY